MAKGHDEDQPERFWWFTIGGGIEEGEDPRSAAVREVFEETGIELAPDDLVGPVLYRLAELIFWPSRAAGRVVLHRSGTFDRAEQGRVDRAGALVIDTQAWWDIDEAAAQIDGEIYPAQILEYARALARRGGDGHMDPALTDTTANP